MDEENDSDVKEIQNCSDKNPPDMSENGSVGTVIVKDVEDVVSVVTSEINEVLPKAKKPQVVRRNSTGAIGKLQVQSRYRGNVRVSSVHDFCKHGKSNCDHDVAVKPWKVVKKPSGSVSGQSLGIKPPSSVTAKRDVLAVTKKPYASVIFESSSSTGESENIARSVDGLSVRSYDQARKNKETGNTLSGSAVVKKPPGLRTTMEKASRISDTAPKNLKNKEKGKATNGEDVKEKTVCVVESSIKGAQRENSSQPSSSKRSSLDPLPTKQVLGSINTGLYKKDSAEAEASPKTAIKIRPKRIGAKVDIAKQLSFRKGKTIEPKSEGSSPRWIKFRRRAIQEPRTPTEGKKKKLKETAETKNDSCEGSKGEKVVLKHRKEEGKKKMMTLFNNVIEETVNKLTKVRKNKVKALIGAFETVISLQDTTKTSQKVHRKAATTSSSQVSPLHTQE